MSLNIPIFILAGLNCYLLNPDDTGSKVLLDFCNSFNLTQMIERPTRTTEYLGSLIDVMLVSNKNLINETNVLANSISDHDLIVASMNLKKSRPKPSYISTCSFTNYDKDAFLDDISNAPWSIVDSFEDTDDKLNDFNLLFYQILDQHAPVKTVKLRTKPNPFIKENIRALMRTRDHWQKLATQTNDPAMWSGYRNFKREVRRELRLAEREFIEEQIRRNSNNVGSIWKTIRSCIPKKPTNIRSFANDDQTVANEFNRFLTSVGQATVDKIQLLARRFNYVPSQVPFIPRNYPISEQFFFGTVECSHVTGVVNSISNKKAPRIDKIPPRVIKESLPVIVPCITTIINSSLASGVFPAPWKIAEVCPILKDGDHEEASNYRPISLLPILSKVCEISWLHI